MVNYNAKPPARRGPGRPPGKLSESTKISAREKVAFNRMASLNARRILYSQLAVALGTFHMLELIRDPKNVEIIWERRIVRDIKRQEKFLESGEYEYGRDFIIVEGALPDWRAGDAILNRAWGRAKEVVEIEGDVQFSIRALQAHMRPKDAALPDPDTEMLDANKDVQVLDTAPSQEEK